jgi:hypothetical protein
MRRHQKLLNFENEPSPECVLPAVLVSFRRDAGVAGIGNQEVNCASNVIVFG